VTSAATANRDAAQAPDGTGRVAGVREMLERAQGRSSGRLYGPARWFGAIIFSGVVVGLVVTLLVSSWPAFQEFGLRFLWSGTLNSSQGIIGAGTLLVGTVVTTAVGLFIAVPVGVGTAAFLSELAPKWLATPLAVLIDLLAAVPSIVVGLWGLLVLSPLFAHDVEPFLKSVPVVDGLFSGPALGPSALLAGVVIAIMLLPTVVALTRVALRGVATADREAAMALGATHWQVVRRAVIPGARPGIQAALTLAMGRALGESIAVAMVIGNRPAIPHSLLAPTSTLGAEIVNQFAEATSTLQRSSVIALALILLVLTALVNGIGQLLLRSRSRPARAPRGLPDTAAAGPSSTPGGPS
jgi:phosphate transport system permease protein